MTIEKKYGLVGKNIQYSFSKKYFSERFDDQKEWNYSYENFDIESIFEFKKILLTENLAGLNVTIPYKQEVIPFLDKLSKKAREIGAVNTIKFTRSGKTKGYNTDWYGFSESIGPLLKVQHTKALILGTGGASKAVAYALRKLNIDVAFVSRNKTRMGFTYEQLNQEIVFDYNIVINCTPLGTSPNVDECPNFPYEFVTENHLFMDLIYNPEETLFLKKAKEMGATIKNGHEMLVLQAEKSWEIWNK